MAPQRQPKRQAELAAPRWKDRDFPPRPDQDCSNVLVLPRGSRHITLEIDDLGNRFPAVFLHRSQACLTIQAVRVLPMMTFSVAIVRPQTRVLRGPFGVIQSSFKGRTGDVKVAFIGVASIHLDRVDFKVKAQGLRIHFKIPFKPCWITP